MITRKLLLSAAAAAALMTGCAMQPSMPGATGPAEVEAAAERLRMAMVDPAGPALTALTAPELSYGHSGGRVDTQASFIADLLNGNSDFVTLTITEQTVRLVDANTAIVRHSLAADTLDSGKPGKVALKVLGVWQRQGGQWKLLARQAVRA